MNERSAFPRTYVPLLTEDPQRKLRLLFSSDEKLADGSSKIWETFINAFVVLKFLSDQICFFLTTYIMNTNRTSVNISLVGHVVCKSYDLLGP